jgi:hypothetical protein
VPWVPPAPPGGWPGTRYGGDSKLREALHGRGIGYVQAIARNHQNTTGIGSRRAIDLARCGCPDVPGSAYQRGAGQKVSAGTTWRSSIRPTPPPVTAAINWLLIRRNRKRRVRVLPRLVTSPGAAVGPGQKCPVAAGPSRSPSPRAKNWPP